MKRILGVVVAAALGGCGAGQWADRISVEKVPADERASSLKIRIFDQGSEQPKYDEVVGELRAVSCQNKFWDPPATKGDALAQIRIKALRSGADALVGVTYDVRGTSYKPNCWESVVVTGTAVKLAK